MLGVHGFRGLRRTWLIIRRCRKDLRRRPLGHLRQRHPQRRIDRLHVVNVEILELLGREIFFDVHLVLRRKNYIPNPGAFRGQHFLFDSADRKHVAAEGSAVAMVTPAEGPSFGIAPAGT